MTGVICSCLRYLTDLIHYISLRLRHVDFHQAVQPLPEREGHVLQTGGC